MLNKKKDLQIFFILKSTSNHQQRQTCVSASAAERKSNFSGSDVIPRCDCINDT